MYKDISDGVSVASDVSTVALVSASPSVSTGSSSTPRRRRPSLVDVLNSSLELAAAVRSAGAQPPVRSRSDTPQVRHDTGNRPSRLACLLMNRTF